MAIVAQRTLHAPAIDGVANNSKKARGPKFYPLPDQGIGFQNTQNVVNLTAIPVALVSLLSERRSAQPDRRPAKVRVGPRGPRPQLSRSSLDLPEPALADSLCSARPCRPSLVPG